jgi:cupin fold WbuC family metalloprotein
MDVQLINEDLLNVLRKKAKTSERKRKNFDLRTMPDDNSQRMLNVMEVGTEVPIHRHDTTTETVVCIKGKLDWVFYEEVPNMDAGGPAKEFIETFRITICPEEGQYGIQVPVGVWHTVEVQEPSVIFEAKDGAYVG